MTPSLLVGIIVGGLILGSLIFWYWSNMSNEELAPPEPEEEIGGQTAAPLSEEGRFRQLLDEERVNFLSLVRKNWEDEKVQLEKLFDEKNEKVNNESIGKVVEEKINQAMLEKMGKIADEEKIVKVIEGKLAKVIDEEKMGKIIENKVGKLESKIASIEEKLPGQLDKLSARFEETLKSIRVDIEKIHQLSSEILKDKDPSLQRLDELAQKIEASFTGGKTEAQNQDELEFFFSRLNEKILNLQQSISELAGNR
ncbi:MAG: hypothetical protein ABII74_06425 [Elusimicrobiota bacterium]